MGSTWTSTPDKYGTTDVFGTKKDTPVYLQFVPGVCVRNITSVHHRGYDRDETKINSILAMPHVGGKTIKKMSMQGEGNRYLPLLRGIVDVPTSGDPVLLCTFAGTNYYLGPLNSDNNPNNNRDIFINQQVRLHDPNGPKTKKENTEMGFFPMTVRRLHKEINPMLDYPTKAVEIAKGEFLSTSVAPDMILEGRHGNSIRLGTRNVFPYMFLSNGRSPLTIEETTLDKSIISMTTTGSLRQHFKSDYKLTSDSEKLMEDGKSDTGGVRYLFTLADDELETVHKSISKTFSTNIGRGKTEAGENDPDVNRTIYGYTGPQTLLASDRLTFNARNDSIFMSSKQFFHLGSGNSMTFSTSNNLLFEASTSSITNVPLFKVNSQDVYIDGRKIICLGHPEKDAGTIESACKGEHMLAALNAMVDDMKQMMYTTAKMIATHKVPGNALRNAKKMAMTIDQTKKLINSGKLVSKFVKLK